MGIVITIGVIALVLILGKVGEYINDREFDARKATIDSVADFLDFNPKTNTLIVRKRDPKIDDVMYWKEYKASNWGYEEEKYVYTGASVGGITMGGVHKTGGNYIEKINSNKCQLMCMFYDDDTKCIDHGVVKKIKLSDESLVLKAQKSRIKKYLKNDCIIVEEKINEKGLNNALLVASRIGDMNMAGNFRESAILETLPTREKCRAIVNWLIAGK